MSPHLKQLSLVLAVALSLFGVVLGLTLILQPEPMAQSIPEPPTNGVVAVAAPALGDQAKEGASLFSRNCAHCHGADARGDEGPDLYDLIKTDARITKIIKEGIKGEMPRFESKFTDSDIQALIAFLRTLKS